MEVAHHHNSEAGSNYDSSSPTQGIGSFALFGADGLSRRHRTPEQIPGDAPTQVSVIIDSTKKKSHHRNVDKPTDELAAKHLKRGVSTPGGQCQQDADQTEERPRATYAELAHCAAQ